MPNKAVHSRRRTIRLTEARRLEVLAYQEENQIRTENETIDRLIGAGLAQKIQVICKAGGGVDWAHRRSITLSDTRWAVIEIWQRYTETRTLNGMIDRLIGAGLTVKVATVNKNAKRKGI